MKETRDETARDYVGLLPVLPLHGHFQGAVDKVRDHGGGTRGSRTAQGDESCSRRPERRIVQAPGAFVRATSAQRAGAGGAKRGPIVSQESRKISKKFPVKMSVGGAGSVSRRRRREHARGSGASRCRGRGTACSRRRTAGRTEREIVFVLNAWPLMLVLDGEETSMILLVLLLLPEMWRLLVLQRSRPGPDAGRGGHVMRQHLGGIERESGRWRRETGRGRRGGGPVLNTTVLVGRRRAGALLLCGRCRLRKESRRGGRRRGSAPERLRSAAGTTLLGPAAAPVIRGSSPMIARWWRRREIIRHGLSASTGFLVLELLLFPPPTPRPSRWSPPAGCSPPRPVGEGSCGDGKSSKVVSAARGTPE